jgi:hypothetical protein
MDFCESCAQVGPHMHPEEASDIDRFDVCPTELQPKNVPIDQRKYENRSVGNSGSPHPRIQW